MPYSIMMDSGHGGRDPGAVYKGRQEKDDALRLALAVGRSCRGGAWTWSIRGPRISMRRPTRKPWRPMHPGRTSLSPSTGILFLPITRCPAWSPLSMTCPAEAGDRGGHRRRAGDGGVRGSRGGGEAEPGRAETDKDAGGPRGGRLHQLGCGQCAV